MCKLNDTTGKALVSRLVILALLGLGGLTAWAFFDARTRIYAFEEHCYEMARFGSSQSHDALVQSVLKTAEVSGVPVTKDEIDVHRKNGRIEIQAHYTVPVKTPLFTYRWKVNMDVESVSF